MLGVPEMRSAKGCKRKELGSDSFIVQPPQAAEARAAYCRIPALEIIHAQVLNGADQSQATYRI